MSVSVESFQNYADQLLNFTMFTYILLFLIDVMFLLSSFEQNVVNSLPAMLLLIVGVFTWSLKSKLAEVDSKEGFRAILIQYVAITIPTIVIIIFFFLTYPIN